MPVRNIVDKKLRIQLSEMDQADLDAMYQLAMVVAEGDGEDPVRDAIRLLREIVYEDPEHQTALTSLQRLEKAAGIA